MGAVIRLSPSKLSVFKECPRCFWNAEVGGVPRPRGPFPSLPGGMDLRVKAYFDKYRGGMPPQIAESVPGALYADQAQLKRWRFWRTGLTVRRTAWELIGAIDDLVVTPDGRHAPLDYKTKGSEPRDDGSQYYQHQLDCYDLMLTTNGHQASGDGYLCYLWPEIVTGTVLAAQGEFPGIDVQFRMKTFHLKTDGARAVEMIDAAVVCIQQETPPEPSPNCEYCRFAEGYAGVTGER